MKLPAWWIALTLVACGRAPAPPVTPAPPPPADAAPGSTPETPAEAPPGALPAGFPATPAAGALAWGLDVLGPRGGVLTRAEAEARFAPAFLAAVPVDNLIAAFAQMAPIVAQAQLTEVAVDGPNGAVARLQVDGDKLVLRAVLDPATGLITGFQLGAERDDTLRPSSLADAVTRLPQLGGSADATLQRQLLVAEVDGGRCTARTEAGGQAALAIGSTFKLYVLLAVVDQILAGKLSWDTPITIRDEWKSLPSGITQDDAAGTTLTVRTLAERMISISDNTATDHLLLTVGRAKVEAALKSAKASAAARNIPFLTTRELFVLKLGTEAERAAYLKLSAKKRRAFLDGTIAGKRPELASAETWTTPRAVDQLEWFATPMDLCRVLATLDARAAKAAAAPLREVLAKNPGVSVDGKAFPYVGFKGGSEPGVLNMTWLLGRADGKRFVVSLGVVSTAAGIDGEGAITGYAAGLLEALGHETP